MEQEKKDILKKPKWLSISVGIVFSMVFILAIFFLKNIHKKDLIPTHPSFFDIYEKIENKDLYLDIQQDLLKKIKEIEIPQKEKMNFTLNEKTRFLEELLKKYPDNPDVMLELAKAYNSLHRYNDAYLQLKEILKKYPDYRFANEIKDLIEDYEKNYGGR